jgi:DNA-binding transcriptional MerR regulator/quercetin dioxygenase-like cupin family protein
LHKRNHAGNNSPAPRGLYRIGDVARRVGVSPSVLRTWESLGLVKPRRTGSHYRLYTAEDLRLLKRARFLRRVQGLNPRAIVHVLKSRGMLSGPRPRPASPLGPQLRRLRLARHLSLATVTRDVGISVAFLSAIERGQMSASVSTLRRLARFYGMNILSLYEASGNNLHRVRPQDRKVLEAGPGVRMELLAWGDTVMEPHLFRIAPGAGSGEAYLHEGEEFLYVLRGRLEIALDGGESFQLQEGDSFYFESTMPHQWVNGGKQEAWVLWINTPPTF